MCMFGGSPSIPEPAPVEPPPEMPKETDVAVKAARDDSRRKALAASGRSGDIVTGDYGLAGNTASTKGKSLLGV
jgi:hypothetical protein